ncbi:MAG: type II toxin-antitoxin system VapC family toxin [Rhizomicrobium sp.]
MSVYLDASVLVALLTDDSFSTRADAYFRGRGEILLVSDFAAAEFASVVARSVRTKQIDETGARSLFADFDVFRAAAERVETVSADVRSAEAILRRLDLPLRTPDALHISISRRLGAVLATFDAQMAASARVLGLALAAL